MWYALSWFLIFALLTVWSVCVWLVHSVVAWSITGAGALAGQAQQLEFLALPEWAAIWLSADVLQALNTSLASVLPWLASISSAFPVAVSWLEPLAWIVWGVGFLLLGVGGLLLHGLIAVARKTSVA